MIRVIQCDEGLRSEWDSYVHTAPGASFYHRYAWREINREELGHTSAYFAAVEDDRFVGVLPVVRVKSRLFGDLACSMPFVNFGGPCADTPEGEQALLRQASAWVVRERIEYLELRARCRLPGDLPSVDRKVSMTVDLKADPDEVWAAFKGDHRRDIRRAYKNGLSARVGGAELLDPFYAVLAESWHGLGTPLYRKRYFSSIMATFPSECRICVVFKGDEPAAAAFDGSHRDVTEGMWLGVRGAFRQEMAGYVLYWELIKDACERGFTRFHLGRSTADSGGEVFKRKWNAYATQLYWQYVLGTRRTVPALNVDNKRYRLGIAAWRKLPSAVVQWLGPPVARCIP